MWHVWWSKKHSHNILVERPEVKRPLGRPSRRWENNTTINLKQITCKGLYYIILAQEVPSIALLPERL